MPISFPVRSLRSSHECTAVSDIFLQIEPNRRKIAGLANPLAEIEQEAAANPDTFELQPTHLRKFLAYLGSDVEQWSDPDAYAIYSFVDSLPLSLNCDNDANSLLFIELLESYRDFETCIPTQDRGMVSVRLYKIFSCYCLPRIFSRQLIPDQRTSSLHSPYIGK